MANNTGTLVAAPVRPASEADTFPSAIANEVRGGLHTVDTLGDRDLIPTERRAVGMLCAVADAGGFPAVFQLVGGTSNAAWRELHVDGRDYADAGDFVTHPSEGTLFGLLVPRPFQWVEGGAQLTAPSASDLTLTVLVAEVPVARITVAAGETESGPLLAPDGGALAGPLRFLQRDRVRVELAGARGVAEFYYFLKGEVLTPAEVAAETERRATAPAP